MGGTPGRTPTGHDDGDGQDPARSTLTRRSLLVAGGTGLIVAGSVDLRGLLVPPAHADDVPLTLDLVRREDMLVLRFEFHNLAISTASQPPVLVPEDVRKPSYVVVWFGPQHLKEQTVREDDEPPEPGRIRTEPVGPSRIAFLVPRTVKSLPFTEEGLFGWWQWAMQVVPVALPPNAVGPFPNPLTAAPGPAALVTDLLLVDWLHLSPDRFAGWSHAPRPVTHNGRTELWHTRLTRRASDGRPAVTGEPQTVRAIWADSRPAGTPFKAMIGENDTADDLPGQIVKATTYYNSDLDIVAPVTADLLLLSALGSSVELRGDWLPDAGNSLGVNLAQWRHRSSLGRDNYVKLVQYGFLFPFGHRAVKVIETQRRIDENGAAYLFQREFVIVRQPVKTYPETQQPNDGRSFPFTSIRLTTTTTPDLPADRDPIAPGARGFWVQREDSATGDLVDLPFPVVATDLEGRATEFTCSLAFVYNDEAIGNGAQGDDPSLGLLLGAYGSFTGLTSGADSDPRRTVQLDGQGVAFMRSDQPDDTTYPVTRLYLGAEGDPAPTGQREQELSDKDLPSFFPTVLAADVRLPAVEALAGQGTTSTIGYDKVYVETPPNQLADANPAQLFARVQRDVESIGDLLGYFDNPAGDPPDNPVTAAFSEASDKVGGVAVPNLSIGALSRTFGPLSGSPLGLSDLQQGGYDPADLFPEVLGAKLLGGIGLADILDKTPTLGPGNSGPTIVTTTIYPAGDRTRPPEAVLTTFDWAPKLTDNPATPFQPVGPDGDPGTLMLHGEFRTDLASGRTSSLITGDLRNFTLYLVDRDGSLSFIQLAFSRFAFEQRDGAKPQFDVDLARVEFINQLSFVNTLREFLSSTGSGPSLDIQPSGVTAGYTLPIPTVSVGVFSLQNMSFSAGVTLPFDGGPVRARFAFCSRESPFIVSVYVFGGGGFFELELGTDGLRKVEAAIEFGGVLSLDIVVASGSLTVMAGVYFKYELDDDSNKKVITLRGYVRATGKLSVLGLITITAEFYLALEYEKADGSPAVVRGVASLKVSIDILFFSATVTVTVEKTFAGSDGGAAAVARTSGPALSPAQAAAVSDTPQFAELMSQHDWNAYCDSFAA